MEIRVSAVLPLASLAALPTLQILCLQLAAVKKEPRQDQRRDVANQTDQLLALDW